MEKSQNEQEILSADEQKVREMCLSLKKVDAPADFDFKLKARIASAKPSALQPRFGFALRYGLPALALILVLGLLAFNGGFLSSNDNPFVAESSPTPPTPALPQNGAVANAAPPETPNQNSAVLPANQSLPKAPQAEVAVSQPKKSEADKKRKVKNDNFMGSVDKGLKEAPKIGPKGFDPKAVPQNIQNSEPSNPISVKEVLSTNGINADLENGKWKVRSVTANSVGESSGVKENDVIEAIDNQPLAAETVFIKTAKGQTITITRNGEKSQLKLSGKQ